MRQTMAMRSLAALLLLLATACLVHVGAFVPAWPQTAKPKAGPTKKPAPPPQVHYGTEGLPRPVLEAAWRETNGLYEEIGSRNERFRRIWTAYRAWRDRVLLRRGRSIL